MHEGSYLGLCFRAKTLDLKVKLELEPGKDPAKDLSRLSRLWVENKDGAEQGTFFLNAQHDDLDEAAESILEQMKSQPA